MKVCVVKMVHVLTNKPASRLGINVLTSVNYFVLTSAIDPMPICNVSDKMSFSDKIKSEITI
jgi:hypothetical protein